MPLPICALSAQAGGEANGNVAVLIRSLIQAVLRISVLRIIGPGFHRGVYFIAGAVEESGVDKDDRALSRGMRMQAARFALVRRSSSMMPILRVFAGKAEDPAQRAKKSHK